MTTMTLKLAEALDACAASTAPGAGRLLHLRVVNQNNLIVNLPYAVFRDNEFTLSVIYSGRLEPSEIDREAIALAAMAVAQSGQAQERDVVTIPLEPRYIYSNNSYWYPQSTVSDYALGTLRLTVPNEFDVVATGTLTGPPRPATAVPPAAAAVADVRVPERSAGAVPVVRHQPVQPGRRRRTWTFAPLPDRSAIFASRRRTTRCARRRAAVRRPRRRPPRRQRRATPTKSASWS